MLPDRVTITDSVICQRVKDEAILLDMSTQQYFGLNATGTQMWDLLSELRDTAAVLSAMEAKYLVSREAVKVDLEGLVRQLIAVGLISEAQQG